MRDFRPILNQKNPALGLNVGLVGELFLQKIVSGSFLGNLKHSPENHLVTNDSKTPKISQKRSPEKNIRSPPTKSRR